MSHFLKCDACEHVEDVPGGITKDHIGKPCPSCGADLLTDRDYSRFITVMSILPGPQEYKPDPEATVSAVVHVHNGEITIRISEATACPK
jgi:hypothetical protein